MSEYKLIDYPQCAICEYSQQYIGDTFICVINDKKDRPIRKCGGFELNNLNLASFITILTEMIKKDA